jgi:hypothetical protein
MKVLNKTIRKYLSFNVLAERMDVILKHLIEFIALTRALMGVMLFGSVKLTCQIM